MDSRLEIFCKARTKKRVLHSIDFGGAGKNFKLIATAHFEHFV
jgi:hypothetical protein